MGSAVNGFPCSRATKYVVAAISHTSYATSRHMIRNAFVIGVTSSKSNVTPSGSTRPSFSAAFSGDVRVTVFRRWISSA